MQPLFADEIILRKSAPLVVNLQNPEQSRWFAEEVQPHEPALRAYLTGSFPTLLDIDDLVQDAYARLLNARNAGTVSHPKAYLFATARNAALDLFRRRKIVSIEALADIEQLSVLEDGPDAAELRRRMQARQPKESASNHGAPRCA